MAHLYDSGFSVREVPWHGLGAVLDDYPQDWAEARKFAGIEWEPKVVPAYIKLDEPRIVPVTVCSTCGLSVGSIDEGTKEFECIACNLRTPPESSLYVRVENTNIVTRDDTGAAFGPVTDTFAPVLNAQMGELLEALLGETNVKLETLISLKGGALINALVWLDEPVNVAGDDSATFPFLSLSNAHDGSAALRALFTAIRVVCWNTYSAALASAERDKSLYTFRHVGNISERLEEAKLVLQNLRADNSEWVEVANDLYKLPAREAEVKTFTELFLPTPPAGTYSDRVAANIDRDRSIFTKLYNESYTTEGHRGTGLGLVDAAVEYLDHVRGFRNADTKFGRSLLRTEPLKAKAVSLVREICTVGAN